MAHAPDRLKLAKVLLHFSAQRGCDCIVMRWADYDGKGIYVRPRKTHGEVDALPNYHLCPKPLRDALDKAPRAADSVSEARASIGRYLGFYNGRRPHSSLDGATPDQAYFNPLPLRTAA